jgi:hypothetical protein
VQPDDRTGAELTAQVLVKHIVRGKEVERHTGLAGTAVVTEVADSIGAQTSGTRFAVAADVEFSDLETLQRGCSFGGDVDGGVAQPICTCQSADGTTLTCQGALSEPSCCIDVAATRHTVPIRIDSAPCEQACLARDLTLRTYCSQLGASSNSL